MTTNDLVHTPDYLIDMLETEAQTGSTDLFRSDDSERLPPMRRIEFPQQNSRKHGGQAGKIFISGLTADQEGEYVDYIDLLLVDPLVIGRDDATDWMQKDGNIMNHMPYGGRTMWEFDEQGKRVSSSEAPVCSSNNGLEPWRQYRDKEYFDYRTKETHRIGWTKDEAGAPVPMPNACVGCPFAQDVTVPVGVDAEGKPVTKWFSSMCRESYTYVVWDVDRKELMTLKAVNLGMQFALTGRRNKAGRRYDGEEFKGIRHYFSHLGGFWTSPDTGKRYPTFSNRPQGKPSVDNPNAPVHPVRMTVTLNNFDPNTYVPNFTVLDGKGNKMILGVNPKKGMVDGSVMIEGGERTMTPEEYVAYLKDQQMFIQDDMKNRMMAMYLVTRTDVPATFERQLPAGAAEGAQLPATTPADTTADYDNPF
jgi:hypothetical protein